MFGKVVAFLVEIDCPPKFQENFLVFDRVNLLSELLSIVRIELKELVLDEKQVAGNFFLCLENFLIRAEIVAQFLLQLSKIGLIGLVEFVSNVCEVNDIAVAHLTIWTIDAG